MAANEVASGSIDIEFDTSVPGAREITVAVALPDNEPIEGSLKESVVYVGWIDLEISEFTAPEVVARDEPFMVSWSETFLKGADTLRETPWTANVFLSEDNQFDSNDLLVRSADRSVLSSDESVQATHGVLQISLPRMLVSTELFLILVADRENAFPDFDRSNNVAVHPFRLDQSGLSIRLASDSDTGTYDDDGITRHSAITFDLFVPDAGRLLLDYDQDGNWDWIQDVANPGWISHSPTIRFSEGDHRVVATLARDGRYPLAAMTDLRIDHTPPSYLGPMNLVRPVSFYQEDFLFDEAIVSDQSSLLQISSIRESVTVSDNRIRWELDPQTSSKQRTFDLTVHDIAGNRTRLKDLTLVLDENICLFYNPNEIADVNGDGRVSALDAVSVINTLRLIAQSEGTILAPPNSYPDTNCSHHVTALDALVVLNTLSAQRAAQTPEWIAVIDAPMGMTPSPQVEIADRLDRASLSPDAGVDSMEPLPLTQAPVAPSRDEQQRPLTWQDDRERTALIDVVLSTDGWLRPLSFSV